MEDFVRRFRAKATKARQAQSRIKALERMQRIAPAHVDSPFEFSFAEPLKLPRPLLAIQEQSAGYGERVLLEKVDLTIYPGDRISLLGRNGAGKSTLVKLLAGELPARGGTRDDARDLNVGYFAQHQLEQLDPQASAFLHLQRLAQKLGQRPAEQDQRNYLGELRLHRRSRVRGGGPVLRRREGAPGAGAGRVWQSPTCCCWTNPPTTWTWRCARRWPWRCRNTPARW